MPKSNYNFCRALTTYLTSDDPLYFDQQAFDDCPVMLDQMMVIKNLINHNSKEAETYWNKLRAISEGVYWPNFVFRGETCLFSLALEKAKKSLSAPVKIEIEQGLSKQQMVEKILNESSTPISIDELFELVWGRPSQNIQEKLHLQQIITRIRKKGTAIEFKNGAYRKSERSA